MSDFRAFADALRTLLGREALRRSFISNETTEAARNELHVTQDMADELKNILLAIEQVRAAQSVSSPAASSTDDDASRMRSKTLDSIGKTQEFLDTSFGQLRTAYRVSLAMSVSLFVAGITFLAIAVIRSFTHPEGVTGTAVVAGIGIVQIVALFYRNPLRDVGRTVSDAQKSRMAIMSYMLGVSLVGESVYHGKQTDEALRRLAELTHGALQRIGQFAEDQREGTATSTTGLAEDSAAKS
jgi:hypothetical protein